MGTERRTSCSHGSLLVLLCLGYLGLTLVYAARTEFNPDELQGAYAVHRLQHETPYRDFTPYKTVLGYYLQYPPMRMCRDPWQVLLWLRVELGAINALVLFGSAWLLARRYSPGAVCLGLLFLVAMSNFLERSYEIRSDMLAAWCGLAGLLFLMDRRFTAAGVATAISFFVSQKGVYYILAGDVALAGWLLAQRDRVALRGVASFNGAMLGVLFVYLGFWCVAASPGAVLRGVFLSHHDIAFGDLYDNHLRFWLQTLERNPYFYAVAVLSLGWLMALLVRRRADFRDVVLGVYGVALTVLFLWHKQPWPYFFVMLAPTVFVLHVAFFHRCAAQLSADRLRLPRRALTWAAIVAALLPLCRMHVALRRDHAFQRRMFELVDAALLPGDTYIDGMDFSYHHRQAILPLRWLDRARLEALHAQHEDDTRRLLEHVDAAPVKLMVNNWRIQQLPAPLKSRLFSRYSRAWGNVYTYGPLVWAGESRVDLKFAGRYRVISSVNVEVRIDGRRARAGETIELEAGSHECTTAECFRLQLLPDQWPMYLVEAAAPPRLDFMAFRYEQ